MPNSSPSSSANSKDTSRLTPFSFLLEHETSHGVLPPPDNFQEVPDRMPVSVPISAGRPAVRVVEWLLATVGVVAVGVGVWSFFSMVSASLGTFQIPSHSLAVGPAFASIPAAQSVPLAHTDLASTTPANGIVPARIDIPAIGVHATVEQVGKNAKGNMGTPSGYSVVAWYAPGARPGAPGTAVFAGHLNNSLSMAGVFANLGQLRVGDSITLTDVDGRTRVFVVTGSETYDADAPPDARIFAATGPSQVALITCDGAWDGSAREFDKRLVVFARLAQQ